MTNSNIDGWDALNFWAPTIMPVVGDALDIGFRTTIGGRIFGATAVLLDAAIRRGDTDGLTAQDAASICDAMRSATGAAG